MAGIQESEMANAIPTDHGRISTVVVNGVVLEMGCPAGEHLSGSLTGAPLIRWGAGFLLPGLRLYHLDRNAECSGYTVDDSHHLHKPAGADHSLPGHGVNLLPQDYSTVIRNPAAQQCCQARLVNF